jgi:hypothetical protein
MAGALGTKPKGGDGKGDSRTSRTQDTSVGSGSKPGAASVPIETTAPANPDTMDRD